MDVVMRSVNQRFLDDVVFPALSLGSTDSSGALERLASVIGTDQTRLQIEALMDRRADGGWSEVDADRFQEVVYQLLFSDWRRTPEGWVLAEGQEPYAASLEDTVQLAMMITQPDFPYWDLQESEKQRTELIEHPYVGLGLPAFIAGLWVPFPDFAPGEVLTTRGTNIYLPQDRIAAADWCYRGAQDVQEWSSEMPRLLRELMDREMNRLKPVDVPEANDVMSYWMGKTTRPPQLVVAFSGLGPTSTNWVRDIAALAGLVRRAASREQGLTSIITGGQSAWY